MRLGERVERRSRFPSWDSGSLKFTSGSPVPPSIPRQC